MQKSVYFRRCHLCGAVSFKSADESLSSCRHCGKAWAPFQYFDDRTSPVVGDIHLRPEFQNGEWQPIRGLTVYWESF